MLKKNLQQIEQKICAACERAHRPRTSVQVLAVTKAQPIGKIREAIDCNVLAFGENYVQEALEKQRILSIHNLVEWHFIGHLQSNKVKNIVGNFDFIHAVDRLKLAKMISNFSTPLGLRQKIFVEVNAAAEESKSGVSVAEAPELIEYVLADKGLELCGLMTMPPLSAPLETSRLFFRTVFELGQKYSLNQFSMGTSHDFEMAILEGSTMVRLGTALFGSRI